MTDKSLYGMFKYEHSIHPKKHPSYSIAYLLSVANGSDKSKLWVFQGGRRTNLRSKAGGFAFEHDAPREKKEVELTMNGISEQLWFSRMTGDKNAQFTIFGNDEWYGIGRRTVDVE